MRRFILSFVALMLVAYVLSAASTTLFMSSGYDSDAHVSLMPSEVEGGKRKVDIMADDAYYIVRATQHSLSSWVTSQPTITAQ